MDHMRGMSTFPRLILSSLTLICFLSSLANGFVMNSTGGSFPNSVYLQTTFSYNFVAPSESISYFGPSSSVGKCNIMGYWHTANNDVSGNLIPLTTKVLDKTICTDHCTIASCGYTPVKTGSITQNGVTYTGLTVRNDAGIRRPLDDISASDGLLAPVDYYNFPDLQMLPAVAGAVVPVYNLPELARSNITTPLVLSRSSLVNIFLGLIQVSYIDACSLRNIIFSLTRNTNIIFLNKKLTPFSYSLVIEKDST